MSEPHPPLDHERREDKEASHSSHNEKEAHLASSLPSNSQDAIIVENRDDLGAGKSEAAAKVWGKYSIWVLYISLTLAAYIYGLDSSTTYFYVPFATSSFSNHSLLSSIEVAAQVILAVGKPVIARIADLQSRPFAYCLVVVLYVLGYILVATSKGVSQFAAGRVFQASGGTGLQLLNAVIIADFTSLRYRGLVTSLLYSPFIINAFVGSKIAASITNRDPINGWRWGCGMFAILIPVSLAPVVFTLFWGEWKAKKLGVVKQVVQTDEVEGDARPLDKVRRSVVNFVRDVDLLGLILLGCGFALLLIALTLSASAKGGWNNPSIIAMVVLGPLIIGAFVIYDTKWAAAPIIPDIILKNGAVMAASFTGFFDYISFYLTFIYLTSFIYVVKTPEWSQSDQNYFSSIQNVGLTFFGIVGALYMFVTRRYKGIMLVGLVIRVIGVGLECNSDAELIVTQVLQSFGGGMHSMALMVGVQAAVPHKNMAITTAIFLLITEIGGAIGSAIAGSMWTHLMPQRIAAHLPDVPEETRAELFASIVTVGALPMDDPVRQGVIQAYGDVMKLMLIVALVAGLVALGLSSLMPNYRLGDAQNAVDGLDIAGRKIEDSQEMGDQHGLHGTTRSTATPGVLEEMFGGFKKSKKDEERKEKA
ncbi:MFS general substrate transporter [Serendipita vermifera]|nr:MFS general substrate transporter [Serendipita vermifera]